LGVDTAEQAVQPSVPEAVGQRLEPPPEGLRARRSFEEALEQRPEIETRATYYHS
jgi:hypothetical protein